MITLRPFRALHYDPAVVGDLAAVIAPPYDVIDAEQLDRLYARSPYNAVRLILNREADRYAAAARALAAWRRDGVLVRARMPALYFYVQNFRLADESWRERAGILAAVRLEEFAAGNIRPHERTFARAKADRLHLVRACRVNLSPLFGVYTGGREALAPAQAIAARAGPWIDLTDESGERHRVWPVGDAAAVGAIADRLRDTTVLIADGHHRYETALAYRDERRAAGETDPAAPHHFVLMYLAPTDDPGLVILPTHRVLGALPPEMADWQARLSPWFAVEALPPAPEGAAVLKARLAVDAVGCFGVRVGAALFWLQVRDPRLLDDGLADYHPAVRYLDVTVLDRFVLPRLLGRDGATAAQEGLLTYTHDDARALTTAGAPAAFLVRAPRITQVAAACAVGQTMPEKSTYFYPKLLTGLVFHSLADNG